MRSKMSRLAQIGIRLLKIGVGAGLLWPVQYHGWPVASGAWVVLHATVVYMGRAKGPLLSVRKSRIHPVEDVLHLMLLGGGLVAAATLELGLVHLLLCAGLIALFGLSLLESNWGNTT